MATRNNLRDTRYCEMLVISGGPLSFVAQVYNTLGLNDCPPSAWEMLNTRQLAEQHDAHTVILNGPRHFLMDESSLANPGGIARFGTMDARHMADVDLSLRTVLNGRSVPYRENKVKRTTRFVFKKGRPIFELQSPDGHRYIMQSYSQQLRPELTLESLPGLGASLDLPEGWTYQTRTPDDDLVLEASGIARVIQDEWLNTYQRTD